MTISSALVGYATGDQRQIPSAGSPDAATPNAVAALQAGPWSAIDWEFGSLLQALMPDAKEEPVSPGAGGEKVNPPASTGVQTAAPQTLSSLPQALPANLSLAFQVTSAPDAVVPGPDVTPVASTIALPVGVTAEPKSGDPKAAAVPVKTLVPETATVRIVPRFTPVESRPKDIKLSAIFPGKSATEAGARTIPVRTSDVVPMLRLSALPLDAVVKPQSKDQQDRGVPATENTVEAEVTGTPAVRTSDVVPTFLPNPLPPDIRVKLQPTNAEGNAAPVTKNTVEAEIVGTPAVQTAGIVPTLVASPLPSDIHVEPRVKDAEGRAVPVKETIQLGASATRTTDIAPTLPAGVLPEPQPSNPESTASAGATIVPALHANPLPLHIRSEAEPVSVKQSPPEVRIVAAPTSDVELTPVIERRPEEPAENFVPVKQPVPGISALPTVAAPASDKVITSEPAVAPKTQLAAVQPPNQNAAVRVKVERNQRPDNPENRTDSAKKTVSREVEPQVPPTQASESATKPVETVDKKAVDLAPNVTEVSEDSSLPIPALTDSKNTSAPSPNPNVVAPVLQAPVALAAAPRKIAPEEHSDDPSESKPAGLIAVQEQKPERSSIDQSPNQPALPADKKSTELGQSSIVELKGKGDQPSANDTEIAFTGRLVPRKAAEEPVSRPDSVDAKLEKVSAPPTREILDAPMERQVRPPVEGDHERPTLRTEPGIVVSAVHRDTAPAATDRPAEPLPGPRTASSEIIQEPVNREASGPVREISMRFNDQTQDSAHLRVVEKGGEVLVSVRSGSEQLARTLSSDLGELTHRLEQSGFQAELYRPSATSSSSEPGQDRRDNPTTADQNANKSWSRDGKDSQDHPGQKAREWMDDLEESMGLSQ